MENEIRRSTEPLVGWRTWHHLEPHYLSDIGHRMLWEPRKQAQAKCKFHSDAPDPSCGCGLYSFTSKEEMFRQNYASKDSMVWGTVWLWGKVIEHQRGYKASDSYFKELWIHPTLAHLEGWFNFVYGVPIHVVEATDIPENLRQEYMGYRPPAQPVSHPLVMTAERLWLFCHAPQLPLEVRRAFRNQLRARLQMGLQKKQDRIDGLYQTISAVHSRLTSDKAKIKHLDDLLAGWKSGDVK